MEPDKTVLITGASTGIGLATARALCGTGYRVILTARRSSLPRFAAHAIEESECVRIRPLDVTKPEEREAVLAEAERDWGGIDVLVNNAGGEVQGGIERLALEDFEAMFRTNVSSIFLCVRAALPALRASRGAIVNIGSTVVARPPRDRFGYVASKGAVEAMTRALAVDLGRDGIR